MYLWLAAIIALSMYPAWMELDDRYLRTWPSVALGILPNLLGFSMGGMAIMLAFASSDLFTVITEDGKDDSYFIGIIAAFYHFILAQSVAIFLALGCRIYNDLYLSAVGYWSMCYAVLVTVATAGQLFNIARVANAAAAVRKKLKGE